MMPFFGRSVGAKALVRPSSAAAPPQLRGGRCFSAHAASVVAVGLGNMGAPLAGRIAAQHPTFAFDLDESAPAQHAAEWGSEAVGSTEQLCEHTAEARAVVTCLPNTDATRATVDLVRASLRPGTVWIDATSGRPDEAAALEQELWEQHEVRYLDCAVSGGPVGARGGILAALVGGDSETFEGAQDIIGCFSDKITYLGPAGSGHMVKSINNALLAANLLTASEGLAALARHGVNVPSALQAINGSSGRSWVTMQRFPDNILTGDPYGFALAMHLKDMNNALECITADGNGGTLEAPLLELTRATMEKALAQLEEGADHTDTTKLAAGVHGIDFETLP